MRQKKIWSGRISFADVNVPASLYCAFHPRRNRFRPLHTADSVPLRPVLVSSRDSRPAAAKHRVPALRTDTGACAVVQSPPDAPLPAQTRIIRVEQFVYPSRIDPLRFSGGWYVAPRRQPGEYASLASALHRAGRLGLCRWRMGHRDNFGCLISDGVQLTLCGLREREELIRAPSLPPARPMRRRERAAARELVSRMTVRFIAHSYREEHSQRLLRAAERKAHGERLPADPIAAEARTEDRFLLVALLASLAEAEVA